MLTLTDKDGNKYSDSQEDLRKVWKGMLKPREDISIGFYRIAFSDGRCQIQQCRLSDGALVLSFDLLSAGYTVSLSNSIPATNIRAFLEDAEKFSGTDEDGDTVVLLNRINSLALKHFGNLNEGDLTNG